ncbi:MAG: hypothetical protein AAF320_04475 [Myxococcota bacterium]
MTSSVLSFLTVLFLVCVSGCGTQRVYVRAPQEAAHVVLANQRVPVVSGEASVQLQKGFGPVSYSVYDRDGQLLNEGKLARTQKDPLVTSLSIVGTIVAVPVLAFAGVLVANPSWPAAFRNVSKTAGGNLGAFLANSMSSWTLPIATAFGALGLLPLLGLLRSEKLPDEVVVGPVL